MALANSWKNEASQERVQAPNRAGEWAAKQVAVFNRWIVSRVPAQVAFALMQFVIKKLDTKFVTGSWPVPEIPADHTAWRVLEGIRLGSFVGSDALNNSTVRIHISFGRAELLVSKENEAVRLYPAVSCKANSRDLLDAISSIWSPDYKVTCYGTVLAARRRYLPYYPARPDQVLDAVD